MYLKINTPDDVSTGNTHVYLKRTCSLFKYQISSYLRLHIGKIKYQPEQTDESRKPVENVSGAIEIQRRNLIFLQNFLVSVGECLCPTESVREYDLLFQRKKDHSNAIRQLAGE